MAVGEGNKPTLVESLKMLWKGQVWWYMPTIPVTWKVGGSCLRLVQAKSIRPLSEK
jgi:hypothetical protein